MQIYEDLNTFLTGGDPVRDLLQWLDQGDTFPILVAGTSGAPLWKSVNRNGLSILKTTGLWIATPG
ncbi:MAG: hypothetical protein AXA67_07935 [Methylothermaceae bacteria B42]|nr:MAG: hypothetical protein AXA67_07935 [Methylothermaceae bacteria B42]